MDNSISRYDIKFKGVTCYGVTWDDKKENKFYFTFNNNNYEFKQKGQISFSADTDHIRYIIENQFLPWVKVNEFKINMMNIINSIELSVELSKKDIEKIVDALVENNCNKEKEKNENN